MQIHTGSFESQFLPEVPSASRKSRKEILPSAAMPRAHYFSSPRFKRHSVFAQELSQRDHLTILCAQLRLLRLRAEAGIIVTADAIARAERLAGSLPLSDAANETESESW